MTWKAQAIIKEGIATRMFQMPVSSLPLSSVDLRLLRLDNQVLSRAHSLSPFPNNLLVISRLHSEHRVTYVQLPS